MNKNVPYFIVAPGMILLLFFLMIPLVTSILPTIFSDQGVTLSNYLDFLKTNIIYRSFGARSEFR
ncbi:spermidine/putrescine ABC transporter permease [Enterococcus termitis]